MRCFLPFALFFTLIFASPSFRNLCRYLLWSCGTITVAAFVDLFPETSVHLTVTVYSRPSPVPERSALRFTVRLPVIAQSGVVSPSPKPLTGSLLVTEMI